MAQMLLYIKSKTIIMTGGIYMSQINSGDTAFVLISAALVCLMTPGLAFFYGGLVRKRMFSQL